VSQGAEKYQEKRAETQQNWGRRFRCHQIGVRRENAALQTGTWPIGRVRGIEVVKGNHGRAEEKAGTGGRQAGAEVVGQTVGSGRPYRNPVIAYTAVRSVHRRIRYSVGPPGWNGGGDVHAGNAKREDLNAGIQTSGPAAVSCRVRKDSSNSGSSKESTRRGTAGVVNTNAVTDASCALKRGEGGILPCGRSEGHGCLCTSWGAPGQLTVVAVS